MREYQTQKAEIPGACAPPSLADGGWDRPAAGLRRVRGLGRRPPAYRILDRRRACAHRLALRQQASRARAQRFMDALEHDHSPREIASIPAKTIDGFKIRNGVARITPHASCPSTSMRSPCAVIRARTLGAAQRHNGGGDNGPTASLADASERGCGASASSGCAAIGRTASTARCVRDRHVSR